MTNQHYPTPAEIRQKVFSWYATHKADCSSYFDMANSTNIASIYENTTSESEINALFSKTDILILTANEYERKILHCLSNKLFGEIIKEFGIELNTAIKFYNQITAYSFNICGYSVLNIHTAVTGAYTNGGAADAIRFVLSNKYLRPSAVVSFGICFGTEENRYNIGDVILSKKVYPYFIGARVEGNELKVRDDNVLNINETLRRQIESVRGKNYLNQSNLGFSFEFGNYTTGEAVISSSEFREQAVGTTTQTIVAGDMEAYGVFRECKTSPYNIPCIVLKAICDWGIEKSFNKSDENVIQDYYKYVLDCSDPTHSKEAKNEVVNDINYLMDKLQAYAAKNAFDVLKILLENNVFEKSVYSKLCCLFTGNDYIGDLCSGTGVRTICNKTVCNYGYTIDSDYICDIIFLLEKDGVIYDVRQSPKDPTDISFKLSRNT